jgi:protein O-GlcNAc transferase
VKRGFNVTSPDGGAENEERELRRILRPCVCAACGHHVAVPFYDGGLQPLATLAWPGSADEARGMERLPVRFVRCVECGHVYNPEFEYSKVPYSEKPNLMFNRGTFWKEHLGRVRELLLRRLPLDPTVVEIGCGDAHLLRALAEAHPQGRYIGFDPNASVNTGGGLIEARNELFDPAIHLSECRPDLIISRHVLEHLIDPMGFLQALAFAVSWEGLDTRLFIEVPCIDKTIPIARTCDFFYEHNSNFTTESFTKLLQRCSREVELVERSYDDEVIYGFVRIGAREGQASLANESLDFAMKAQNTKSAVISRLNELFKGKKKVAIWGGTGKAAAFINRYELDADRFPLVVDSDKYKVGTFVPGTGQEILFRDHLKSSPVDVIVIATQWRAKDIVHEIKECGIPYDEVMLESDGRLVDYFRDPNIYNTGE